MRVFFENCAQKFVILNSVRTQATGLPLYL